MKVNFYRHNNIYINYDIDVVAVNESDEEDAIQVINQKKNKGLANILISMTNVVRSFINARDF